MSVEITGFNVTNHREAHNNNRNSYKFHSMALKFYASALLMMLVSMEFVRYSQISDIAEHIEMLTFGETDIFLL